MYAQQFAAIGFVALAFDPSFGRSSPSVCPTTIWLRSAEEVSGLEALGDAAHVNTLRE